MVDLPGQWKGQSSKGEHLANSPCNRDLNGHEELKPEKVSKMSRREPIVAGPFSLLDFAESILSHGKKHLPRKPLAIKIQFKEVCRFIRIGF